MENDYLRQGKDAMQKGEWDNANACFTLAIDNGNQEAYLERAKARCFQNSKKHIDGNFDDVVEDASIAIAAGKEDKDKAELIRALGYYLSGDYDQAGNFCENLTENNKDDKLLAAAYEILGNIRLKYKQRDSKKDANKESPVTCFTEAMRHYLNADVVFIPSINLIEKYHEACKKQRAADN